MGKNKKSAISPDRDEQPVRCFECFTADLERMADWLAARGVRSVAMQSRGVYWMPVFEIGDAVRAAGAIQRMQAPIRRHRRGRYSLDPGSLN
jgi:hypothetical protein